MDQSKHELLLLDTLGQPAARVQALINGQIVTTNDEGRAELGKLPARYDAVVVAGSYVRSYLGLAARSPTIRFPNSYLATNEYVARVNIAIPNTSPNQVMFYTAGATGEEVLPQTMGYNTSGGYHWADIVWAGPSDATLSAHAFLADVDPDTGSVLRYSGFASKDWPNGGPLRTVQWTPEFEPPAFETKTIHIELSLPANMSVGWYSVRMQLASGEGGPISESRAGASADLIVPDVPGATFDVIATLFGPGEEAQIFMRDLVAGATVHAAGSVGVDQLAPKEDAMNVTPETEFSWSGPSDPVYELTAFTELDTKPRYNYVVATTGMATRLPDTSALGLPFPSGLTLKWVARSLRGHVSLDDYAAAPFAETGTGSSDFRTFTTRP
jgi:hypothetical protein